MSRYSTLILVLLSLIALTLVAGCGGGGSSPMAPPAPHTDPPAFTPTTHSGFAVYLIEETTSSSYGVYVPQSTPDGFSVAPGMYRPICLKQAEIGAMNMKPQGGGVEWPASFTRKGSKTLINPTPSGWVFGPGMYDGVIVNPAGGSINFVVKVPAVDLGGYKVRMVTVDATGKAFDKGTISGYYVPVFTPYKWAQIWTDKDGVVVAKPDRYTAGLSTLSGSENLDWVDGNYVGKVVGGTVMYAVYVYDRTAEPPDDQSVTVDTVAVSFIAGPAPGKG